MDGANVGFADGLADDEVTAIEQKYRFRFPPDLRDFLQTAMPTGVTFPDWRHDDESLLRQRLSEPLTGILFDVEHSEFWLPEWGGRPHRIEDAKTIAEKFVSQAPRLIPINFHRMMPDRPHAVGNPVFSVHQTDIIYYGFDLDDYLRHEFNLPGRRPWPEAIREIEFWDVDRWQALRW